MTSEKHLAMTLLVGIGAMLFASMGNSLGLFGFGLLTVTVAIVSAFKQYNQQRYKAGLPSYKQVPRNNQPSGAKPYASKRVQPNKCKPNQSRTNQSMVKSKPEKVYFPPDKPKAKTHTQVASEPPLNIPGEIPEHLIRRIMRKNVDRATAVRLLKGVMERYPHENLGWWAEKVEFDLDRDRSRA